MILLDISGIFLGGQRISQTNHVIGPNFTPRVHENEKNAHGKRKYIDSIHGGFSSVILVFAPMDPTALPRPTSPASRNRSVERMHGELQASKAQAQKTCDTKTFVKFDFKTGLMENYQPKQCRFILFDYLIPPKW